MQVRLDGFRRPEETERHVNGTLIVGVHAVPRAFLQEALLGDLAG
ncbi:MAG: hypothetical protein ABSH56_11875 [Bryobacteraceae bacterium]